MKRLTPQQIADKWSRNLGASTQSIRDGVMQVQEAPGQRAAAQKDKYLRRVQERVDKWAENVASVSLQAWQQAMLSKGLPIIGTRAEAAKPKFAAFMRDFMQFQMGVQGALANMPRGSLDQNIARAVFVIRQNAEFGKGRGAGLSLAGQFIGGFNPLVGQ